MYRDTHYHIIKFFPIHTALHEYSCLSALPVRVPDPPSSQGGYIIHYRIGHNTESKGRFRLESLLFSLLLQIQCFLLRCSSWFEMEKEVELLKLKAYAGASPGAL